MAEGVFRPGHLNIDKRVRVASDGVLTPSHVIEDGDGNVIGTLVETDGKLALSVRDFSTRHEVTDVLGRILQTLESMDERLSLLSSLTVLKDGASGNKAIVTSFGELVVAPLLPSQNTFKALESADTAVNFKTPRPGQQFMITGIRIKATRSVSTTVDAAVIIYEASAIDTITVDGDPLYEDGLVRGESSEFVPTLIESTVGKFINAKTSDPTVNVNLVGYFRKVA